MSYGFSDASEASKQNAIQGLSALGQVYAKGEDISQLERVLRDLDNLMSMLGNNAETLEMIADRALGPEPQNANALAGSVTGGVASIGIVAKLDGMISGLRRQASRINGATIRLNGLV